MDIQFIMKALRRAWSSYPERIKAINLAKIGNKYQCKECKNLFSRTGIQVDHICPVGSFDTWTNYISRLFVTADKLQILCLTCHKIKTKTQNAQKRSFTYWEHRDREMSIVEQSRMERNLLELAEFFD